MSRFGACILDADELRLRSDEKALFRDVNPFGFILFSRNIDTPDQVRALCGDLREAVGRECPITIDQEGGRVQRLRAPHWREWLPPLEQVQRAGEHAAEAMYLRSRITAHELRAVGVDSNCAPLVDVAVPDTHPFLLNRCYGYEADTVATIGRAVADGHLDGGVLPIVKHIPGHGRARQDSHLELPLVEAELEDLADTDFVPFRALNDLPMAMTAHLVYSHIDKYPATTSDRALEIIREDIGFDGLVMTDDISMKALKGSLSEIAKASLWAGCDVILHCNGTFAERAEVAEAAGEMSDAAQTRADRAIAARKTPDEVDIPALDATLSALMNG
jgi:beta-N-acetylhexosaminidase